jgi:hypothetical protein
VNPRFDIDPYFLGAFVKTGPNFPLLKKAITHEFHDTLALLDERAREQKEPNQSPEPTFGLAPGRGSA